MLFRRAETDVPPDGLPSPMPDARPRCGKAMRRFSGQVRIFARVWIQRVSSAYCAPCGVGQLIPAGTAKLQRAIAATRDVLSAREADPKPLLEFREKDGLAHQVELQLCAK